jgi:hypothetical protein
MTTVSEKQYYVGQILFVGSNKKNQVVPVQVTERVTRETIDGHKIVYSVSTPKNPDKHIDLSTVSGQIFTSLDEARRKMISNAETASQNFLSQAKKEIERMCGAAHQASQRFPQVKGKELPVPPQEELSLDISDELEAYPAVSVLPPPLPMAPAAMENSEEDVIMVPGPDGKEVPARVRSVNGMQKKK